MNSLVPVLILRKTMEIKPTLTENCCIFTTIASFVDVEADEVIEYVESFFDKSWQSVIENEDYDDVFDVIVEVARHFGMPHPLAFTESLFHKQIIPRSTKEPYLGGRGTILIKNVDETTAHIMPYEDGIVYDAAYQRCGSIWTILEYYQGWSIVKWTRLEV